jgi:hypothetical protein
MLRITTLLTYIIFLITAIYYTFKSPHPGHTIWGNNTPSPFAQNSIITSIYWIILLVLQLVYAWSLYSANNVFVTAAANIGAHYIANNLLLFGFIQLWTRNFFALGELLLIVNFFNLSFAYFRHSTAPRMIHIGTVSGPLAWNFVALYWVGARAVTTHDHLAARIVGNVFIWGIFAYGAFFLVAFKDYTMGFNLSILAFCKFPLNISSIVVADSGMFGDSLNDANCDDSDGCRSISHQVADSSTAVDLRFHDWRTSLRAFSCCRCAWPAWKRSLPARRNCLRRSRTCTFASG